MKQELKTDFTPAELEEIKDAKNAYMREWRNNHPDKVKEYNHRYWLKRCQSRKKGSV